MNYSAIILLLILGFLFIAIGQVFIAILCFLALIAIFLAKFLEKTTKATLKVGKDIAKDLEKDLEKSKGQHPKGKFVDTMVVEVGKKSGEFLMSDKPHRIQAGYHEKKYKYQNHEPFQGLSDNSVTRKLYHYKSSKPIKGIGEAAQNIVDSFKKLFD